MVHRFLPMCCKRRNLCSYLKGSSLIGKDTVVTKVSFELWWNSFRREQKGKIIATVGSDCLSEQCCAEACLHFPALLRDTLSRVASHAKFVTAKYFFRKTKLYSFSWFVQRGDSSRVAKGWAGGPGGPAPPGGGNLLMNNYFWKEFRSSNSSLLFLN